MTDNNNSDHHPEGRISDAEWANRRLCPDGNCIGVIGPDGRCKECGQSGGDDLPPVYDAGSDAAAATTDATIPNPTDDSSADREDDVVDDDWANRRLCPDGNCIGVIGPDGRCKECGRPDKKGK